jgi:aldehyde dehydrogenase (NAD+)
VTLVTTPIADIAAVVERTRSAYEAGTTRPLERREELLGQLRRLVAEREDALLDALAADLGKPRLEGWTTEIGFVLADLDHTLAHLRSWARPRRVPTPLVARPGRSEIVPEPLGVACVIAPWNYPLQLLLLPVAAAVAAGNTVVAKPSEVAPATATAVGDLLGQLGDAVGVVQGGAEETTELLAQRFDHIFYTGNGTVGRIVMRAAAEHLTPVTLELGGKSPAMVGQSANVPVAARRIAWGKFVNAGQTCIAPDYVLVHESVHDELVDALVAEIHRFYGADPRRSPDYARIVSDRHLARIEKLLGSGTVVTGGVVDHADRYVAPTVLTGVGRDDPVMREEVFGPVLPVLPVASAEEAAAFVRAGDHPLALYAFSEDDAEVETMLAGTTSGGVCVNGTLMHVSNPYLPFGGVGASGMGAYHGRFGFDTFSHERAVYRRSTAADPPVIYPPYSQWKERVLRAGMGVTDPRDLVAKAANRLRSRRSR